MQGRAGSPLFRFRQEDRRARVCGNEFASPGLRSDGRPFGSYPANRQKVTVLSVAAPYLPTRLAVLSAARYYFSYLNYGKPDGMAGPCLVAGEITGPLL